MLRVVLLVIALAAIVYLTFAIIREMRAASFDWRGIAVAVGLVAVALYLRHLTEIGGLV